MDAPVHLSIRGIGKSFGSTRALDDVSIELHRGSVHAFVGENGAGKSTLGKIIAGVLPQDQGHLVLGGTPVSFASPRQALEHGIALVAQELALVPQMTVAENVFLGAEPARGGWVDRSALRHRFGRLAADAGFDLPAAIPVGRLAIGAQQQVEILRALARDAQLLVFDEPTASLSAAEGERFHRIVRNIAASGRTVVLVSHFLGEVLDLADTVTVLRDGRVVRTSRAADETESTLISGMLGRSLGRTFPPKTPPPGTAPDALVVEGLSAPGVHGVSLRVRTGEIVGLGGLIGAGRSELARAIFGAAPAHAARLALRGGHAGGGHAGGGKLGGGQLGGGQLGGSPAASIRAGVALIPESRKDDGLVLGRPVRENVSLPSLPSLSRLGFIRRPAEDARVHEALRRASGPDAIEAPAAALSGGNQQKVLFARAVAGRLVLLIADEPTRGVDVGAKREIYEHLVALAASGVAVLLISSEIEELLGLAHRVLVMRAGRIVAELEGESMTEAAVLGAAFGATPAAA
jgi:ABC-type sugar transport system ATPase subunit